MATKAEAVVDRGSLSSSLCAPSSSGVVDSRRRRSHLVEVIVDQPASRNLGEVQFRQDGDGDAHPQGLLLLTIAYIDENSAFSPSLQAGDSVLSINKIPCQSKTPAWAEKQVLLAKKKKNAKLLSIKVRVPDGNLETCQTTILCPPPLGINFQRGGGEHYLTVHSLKLSASRGWFRHSDLLRMGSRCLQINGRDCGDAMDPSTANQLASSPPPPPSSISEWKLVTQAAGCNSTKQQQTTGDPAPTARDQAFALWNIFVCLRYCPFF